MSRFVGVAIEDAYLPYDLLFYEAPDSLKVEVGSRILVPFGASNKPKLAYALKVLDLPPSNLSKEKIKKVIAVVERNLFSSEISDLFQFVSSVFLIPIHSLLNKIYGTYSEGELIQYISVIDILYLSKFKDSLRSPLKKNICEVLEENKTISLNKLQKKTHLKISYIKDFLRDLEKNKLVEFYYRTPFPSNKVLVIKNEALFEEILHRKGIQKSVKDVLLRIKKSNGIYYSDALYKIRNGLAIIDYLIKEGVVEEIDEIIFRGEKSNIFKRMIINGGSLKERVHFLSNFIKENLRENKVALIVVNEHALVKILSKLYENEFPQKVFGNLGKEKSEIRKGLRLGKKIIISTPFSLFVDIPNLGLIIIEDASSKYHIPHEFLPFDSRLIAYKRSELENVSLVFSTYSLDDVIYFFHKERDFNLIKLKDLKNQNKRIIDMRREIKSEKLSPLSSYLESKITKVLSNNGNVALVLNRKPYSTFILCGECGYVHRCPVCESPLYFDKESNSLICPTCGHKETPIERCPRCGSFSLLYLGHGIQKLSISLKATFKDANIIIIEGGEERIFDSTKFSRTIFLGTEAIFSHLDFENVDLLSFISADTFLNGSDFNTAFEAFKFLRQASFETYPKDVFVQTYEKENYIIENYKKDDEFGFLRTELSIRKELNYPPFAHLYQLTLSKAIDLTLLKQNLPNSVILGPVERFEGKGKVYEFNIKTSIKPKEFYTTLSQSIKEKIIGARIFPAPTIVDVEIND